MGFFDWLARALGRQPKGEAELPPPPPPPPEYWEYSDEPVVTPEQPPSQYWEYENCQIEFVPGRTEGRVHVFPRWRAINPDADCIRDLFNRAGYKPAYSVIICGEPSSEYPGHEGEEEICLTYKFEGNYMRQIVSSPSYVDAVSFANLVNSESPERLVESWNTCTEIAILDN
jgi:hypothetical protein